jgi:adenosylmethionine-8-amino-7-oxononanoate aminotransferase
MPYQLEEKIGIKVIKEARRQGLIIRPLGNVIVLMPPLSIKPDELKKMLDVVYVCIKEVTGKGK